MHFRKVALSGAAMVAIVAPLHAETAKPAPVAELIRKVDIPYQQFTLKNGLRVVVHTDRKAPVVAVSVWYNVGSKFEPKGKTGFAHLYEHLMFNGSENAPGEFFEPLKQVGATDFNGTTYFDRTNYFETVPTPALERALFLESDRMGHLLGAITQGVLDEQRGVVQNEKRQNDNRPYGLIQYKQTEGLFPADHPYGHTTIGSMADLDAASLEDVKQWFRDHYGPNNAVLVLAGDIDVATAKPLVEKYFGDIKAGPASVAPPAPIPTLPAAKSEVMKDRVAATLLLRSWSIPGLNDPESASLAVAGGVLGGLSSSRLDNILVRKEKLAVQVSANAALFSQLGTFTITAVVRPGVDPATVAKRLDEIVADFIKTGPTADEVNRVATNAVAGRIAGLESVGGFGGKAVALAEGALYSNDPGFYKKRLDRLAAQTPATVKAAMQKWLTRPVYALSVVPGPRDAYDEAKAPAKPVAAAAPAAEEKPAVGKRGALPDVGKIAALSFPKVERTKLSNGIELVYAQRTAVPYTRIIASFDAGTAADVADKLGTQRLMLSVEGEATTTLDAVALAEAQERLGASIGDGVNADRTSLSLGVPSANLAPAVALFADVVQRPAFAEAEVARLRATQLAQIQQELTNPNALAQRVLPKLLYGAESPYAKGSGAGDPAAVASLTRDDLIAYHNAWIRPDKAKLFVVSDKPLAEVKATLEASFGKWQPSGAPGEKPALTAGTAASPRIVLVDRPDSPQSVIAAGIPTPLKGTDDLVALNIANDALGGSFLSRINMDLREAKHWSYGAGGRFLRGVGPTPYGVQAPVQADKTGDSIAALQQDIKGFLSTQPITTAEFDRAVTGGIRSLSGSFETSGDVLNAMEENDRFGRPDNYYATYADRLRALSRDQADAEMRKVLDPAKTVWVVVGDAKVVKPQLDSLGLPVEVVPAASVAGAPIR